MISKSIVVAALFLAALSACGGPQPKIWRVAIDMSQLNTISDGSCFKSGGVPAGRTQISETSLRDSGNWVIWDGIEGKQYLDIGTQTWELGDAPTITIAELIEGQDKVFSGQRNVTIPHPTALNASETRQTIVTVTFNDLGNSPTGTVQLRASYQCVGQCPNPNPTPDSVSCSSQLGFVGRKIEATQTTNYSNEGS